MKFSPTNIRSDDAVISSVENYYSDSHLVEFERPLGLAFVDLADELESILGMRVDLVSRGALNQRGYDSIAPDIRYV